MELRRLRLLHELSRRGTVAAVAEALSYSPSSVSVQLAQLEREADATLLRRVGRNLELTPAGVRLAAYAAEAMAADEAVRTELASADDRPHGRLRMTFPQTPALALLPGVLARLEDSAPDLEVEVVQQETAPALQDLRSRAVDLVVGIEYDPLPVPRQREVDRRDLLREDMLLALHLSSTTPPRTVVSLASCERQVWATSHVGSGLEAAVRNVCNRLGRYEPDIRHRSDDALVLAALVASGRVVALLPALLTTVIPQIAAHPLREERLQRTIFTATRGTTSAAPAVRAVRQAFLETARDVAATSSHLEVVTAES